MPIAQKARQATALVRQLMVEITSRSPEEILAELGGLYPDFTYFFESEERALTVLVPASKRGATGHLLVPHGIMFGASWVIEVSPQQLVPHKCRDGHEDDVVRQFQRAVGLVEDGVVGARTRAAMCQVSSGASRQPAVPARGPSKWGRLMADDD